MRRSDTAELLRSEVAAMNLDNFVVRPKRRLVEKYAKPEAWTVLSAEALSRAGARGRRPAVGAGPGRRGGQALRPADAATCSSRCCAPSRRFARLRDQVKEIAGLLEEKATIPMVREQMPLIQDVQTDEWWQDVTVADAGGGAPAPARPGAS